MGKSGKLKAINDQYISDLLSDPLVRVLRNGIIQTKRDKAGWIKSSWRDMSVQDKAGYKYIAYQSIDGRKQLAVHRIIYAAFCGALDREKVVNHIDGNPSNNTPSNLELVTQGENNAHRFQVLGCAPVKGNTKITQEIANKLRDEHSRGASYNDLIRKYGYSKSTISYAVRGVTWNDNKKPIADHSNAKIDFATAQVIRKKRLDGQTYSDLAQEYNLGRTTVINICLGKTYKTA